METADVLIAGAGPAGLAVAACLRQRGIDAVVVESGSDVGTSWRGHYDCLRLHTVKAYSALPRLHFPREVSRYPSRGEVIAYLERYATQAAARRHPTSCSPTCRSRVLRTRMAGPANKKCAAPIGRVTS